MCDPFTATVAISAIASGYTAYQQNQRADTLNEYQGEVHDANTRNARRAALTEFQALNRRQQEERRRASSAVAAVSRQALLASGTIQAQAETTAGNSVVALIGEFERQAAQQSANIDFNLESSEAQLDIERIAVRARETDRIASTIPTPIPGADYLGLALGLASNILGAKIATSKA